MSQTATVFLMTVGLLWSFQSAPQRGRAARATVTQSMVITASNKGWSCVLTQLHENSPPVICYTPGRSDQGVRWRVEYNYFWSYFSYSGGLGGKHTLERIEIIDLKKGEIKQTQLRGGVILMPLLQTSLIKHPSQMYYDCIPTSKDDISLFILTQIKGEWSLSRYQCLYKMLADEGVVRSEDFPVVFKEPFEVLLKGDTYYFVTASGRLYYSPKSAKGKARTLDVLWNDESRPITHFITDADAERTFLFCKPAKKGEPGVFFEMGPKPEPKPYDLSKVKPSKADEPLKSVLERARFLADQKLLKNPEPPKEEKKP